MDLNENKIHLKVTGKNEKLFYTAKIIKNKKENWEKRLLIKKDAEKYAEIHNSNKHWILKIFHKTLHFLGWVIKLLIPDYFIGHPNLWDNIQILRKNPKFKPLRIAFISWLIILIILFSAGVFAVFIAPRSFASGPVIDSFADTSKIGASSNISVDGGAGQVKLSPSFACGGTFTDSRNNKTYTTVQMGDQCWYSQSLDYDNGCSSVTWSDNTDVGWCGYYPEVSGEGLLYQWSAAMGGSTTNGAQGLCPSGWHIPTDAEFCTMETLVDPTVVCDAGGWRGDTLADKLKSVTTWSNNSNVTNSTGFSVLGTGFRDAGGQFVSNIYQSTIWTSTGASDTYAWTRNFYYSLSGVGRNVNGMGSKAEASSVRCLKNPGNYPTNGSFSSINILSGQIVSSIDSFVYNLSAKPANTEATIQFSQDNDSWYNSSNTLNGVNTLSTGVNNSINLSGLGWIGGNFYYKVTFTSDQNDTPVLDDITVNFTSNTPPNTPVNYSPADATTTVSLLPTLTASSYSDPENDSQTNTRWEVDDNSNFSSPEWVRTAGVAEISTVVNSTNGTFANNLLGKNKLSHNTTYYWRVAYKDSGSNIWSASSTATSFTTNIINPPSNILPASSATVVNLTPILSASSFSSQQADDTLGGTRWIVSVNSDLSNPAYDSGVVPGTDTTKMVPAGRLNNLTSYYWGVAYKNSSGDWSATSSVTSFDINVVSTSIVVKPIFGASTVDQGQLVNMDVQILDYSTGAPINTASTTLNIYAPDGTQLVANATMNYMSGSNGVYRYPYTVPAINGDYLYEAVSTYAGKVGYGTANFDVGTIKSNITSINTNVNTVSTNLSDASSSLSNQIQENTTKLNSLGSNIDVIIGTLVVTQSNVNDSSASTTAFITALTNITNDFYKNAVLTFTSGNLNGQVRRISGYNGSTKTITLDPALTSAPANGDAFTITKQNVRVEEQAANIQNDVTAIKSDVSYIKGKVDNINTILQTVDTNLSSVQNFVSSIRVSQQKAYRAFLSDISEVQSGKTYRAKLSLFDYESQPIDADTIPTITIYDSLREIEINSDNMTRLSAGVYEYTYSIPSATSTSGLWEAIVTTAVGDSSNQTLNDYFDVTGSPAQVIINSISDAEVPSIVANTKITNEGSGDYEYHYEWCVVTNQSDSCGGNNNVYYASASKLIKQGDDFITDLTATVSEVGDYWFKLLVYYGTQVSGASRQFTAVIPTTTTTSERRPVSSPIPAPTQTLTIDAIGTKILDMQKTIDLDSANLAKVLNLLGIIKPNIEALLSSDGQPLNSVKDVQNKLADLQAISSSIKQIVENGSTAPVVQTYMKFNSVVVSFLITNPAGTKQTVNFRAALPAEIKSGDIINLDGLNLDYDTNTNSYYVYGSISLGAKQSISKSVEMKDIWLFSQTDDLDIIKNQTQSFINALANTQYSAQGVLLQNDIMDKISHIETVQKQSYTSPQDHILSYRENKLLLQKVQNDLDKIKDLVVQSGASQGMVGKIGGIQTFATWGIILAIIFGFGLMSVAVFLMWRYQVVLASQVINANKKIRKR